MTQFLKHQLYDLLTRPGPLWLVEANLSGLNLSGVNLEDANLTDAHMNGTNLEMANFKGANLTRAMLRESQAKEAVFEGTNLYISKSPSGNIAKFNVSFPKISTVTSNSLLFGSAISNSGIKSTTQSKIV